ncbi:pseudouridine synthase-like protein TruD/Pus7 [Lepidopterella palustris CBS 459.81]|uniref:Pseudouridine synthase-like protein TruD/Pus7 n=1 Tax=Lepidopterella palustris CBS 459.81 TaxID=1314670 RepID=A0A8E2EI40_9PEZI|nr:pseudouridine synthase-like protein TruD/Pus7 [Lepidopterella palustris CBS 459.81]
MPDEDIPEEQPRKRVRLTSKDASPEPKHSRPRLDSSNGMAAKNGQNSDSELEKEIRAGITEYVSPENPGFTGILKQRYTDFLVNEILPSGQVLHLENLSVPSNEQGEREKKAESSLAVGVELANASTAKVEIKQPPANETLPLKEEKCEESSIISDEDVIALKSIFGKTTTSSILGLYHAVLKSPERKARDFSAVKSEIIADKEQRTSAHQAIRRIFSSRLETITEKDETITIKPLPPHDRGRSKAQQNGGGRGGKGRPSWDELGGEYLHFTLYKENKDTMEVIHYIGSQLKLQPKAFQFAGTKDRRGVTVQRVSAKRVHARTMVQMGKNLWNAKVGDFKYHPHGLQLGDLFGNEFVITMRDCHFPGEEGLDSAQRIGLANKVLSKATQDFKEKGYINYYGLQRFGSFAASTDTVGVKLLQDDIKGAIDDILDFSPEALTAAQDPDSTKLMSSDDKARAEALHIWKTTGKASVALDKLPRRFSAESAIIKHLGFVDRKTGKMLRKNDYQGAMQMIPRNLRLMYVHAYQSFVWNVVAGKRWTLFGPRVVEGDLVLVHEHKHKFPGDAEEDIDQAGEVIIRPSGEDSAMGADDAFERARPLSKVEAESGDYNIFDVVLPQPGFDVEYPKNAIGEFYKEFMKSERGGGLDPHDMRRKWRDISLSGGYRKLLCRPGEGLGFEVREYVREDEQFVETDLERLERMAKEKELKGRNGSGDQTAGENVQMMEVEGDGDGNGKGVKKLAVIIKLQLGASQYATMALRELMKAGGVKMFRPEYMGGR